MSTASVELLDVSKSFEEHRIADSICLEVARGEFLTLLGPSGCGKTTTLRMIAGFETPDAGSILIGGEDVSHLPPYRRNVNTVFQHYALFPHLTVRENIAYGLRRKRAPEEEIRKRVNASLEMIRLEAHGGKMPSQLSGGQKQRVAMARALACDPEVLLLDEPLSALDVKLRKQMQVELRHLNQTLRKTFIFVTHDQEEALLMSDRIAVMNQGRIEQLGSSHEVYDRPRTRFVADFLGVKNLFEASLEGLEAGRFRWKTQAGIAVFSDVDGGAAPGETRTLGVRPEKLHWDGAADGMLPNLFDGRVTEVLYSGSTTSRWIEVDAGIRLEALAPSRPGAGVDARVRIGFASEHVLVLE